MSRATFISLFVHLLCIYPTGAHSCPSRCTCTEISGHYMTECYNLEMRQIPDTLPEKTSQLQLHGNEFGLLLQNSFSQYTFLRSLVMQYCGITDIHARAFHGLSMLTSLDLKQNKIETIRTHAFAGLPVLTRLELDHNLLIRIENQAFSGLGRRSLGAAMSLQMNPDLQDIATLAYTDAKLEELYIVNGSLTSDSLASMKPLHESLRFLFIKNNRVSLEIPVDLFEDFSLMSLDLKGNGITNIEFLANLQTSVLSIPDNPIGSTNFTHFPSLSSVRDLYLDNTSFDTLHSSYFDGLYSLERLSLENNGITRIPEDLRPLFLKLRSISLKGNPLHCNCDLEWLHSFVHREHRRFPLGAECATPAIESIFNMSAGEFQCSAPKFVTVSSHFMDGRPVLACKSNGDPYPVITWTLPGNIKHITQNSSIKVQSVIQDYYILPANASDGEYSCRAHNRLGSESNNYIVDMYQIMTMAESRHSRSMSSKSNSYNYIVLLVCSYLTLCISTDHFIH